MGLISVDYGRNAAILGTMLAIMAKHKATDSEESTIDGTQQLNIRVSQKILNRLERMGEGFGIKRSQMIVRALEEFIIRHEREYLGGADKE